MVPFVVIDTFAKFMPSNASEIDNVALTDIADRLGEVARRTEPRLGHGHLEHHNPVLRGLEKHSCENQDQPEHTQSPLGKVDCEAPLR